MTRNEMKLMLLVGVLLVISICGYSVGKAVGMAANPKPAPQYSHLVSEAPEDEQLSAWFIHLGWGGGRGKYVHLDVFRKAGEWYLWPPPKDGGLLPHPLKDSEWEFDCWTSLPQPKPLGVNDGR